MRLRHRIAIALALLTAVLALPGAALASGKDAIKDCTNDGKLDKTYSQSELASAIANLPADVDEYSDCRDVLRRAQLGGGSSGGSGGGGGSSTGGGAGTTGSTGGGTTGGGGGDTNAAVPSGPAADPLQGATDAERAAFQKAVANGDAPVQLDGRPIYPGELGGAKTSGISDLPAPLLAILALIVLGGLGAAAFGTRRLVHGRRPA